MHVAKQVQDLHGSNSLEAHQGTAHSLGRHPAVFAIMWDDVHAGKSHAVAFIPH